MALIKCPECGKENVSDSAEMCPSCGFGIKAYFEKIEQEKIKQQKTKIIENICFALSEICQSSHILPI